MVAKTRTEEEGPYSFSVEEYESRLKAVRDGLQEIRADLLLVTGSVDIFGSSLPASGMMTGARARILG